MITRSLPYMSVLLLASLASCSLAKKDGGPSVQVVVGTVALTRDGVVQDVTSGLRLKPNDALVTAGAAKMKIAAGTGSVLVGEGAAFKVVQPPETDSGAIFVQQGEYYFAARDGGAIACRFGDMSIRMANADAVLTVGASGRLAEFFVLNGTALVKRGKEQKSVAACRGVVLDAAGITEDEAIGMKRGEIINRLRGWVGAVVIDKAVAAWKCGAEPAAVNASEPAPGVPAAIPVPPANAAAAARAAVPPVSVDTAARLPAPVDTLAQAKQPAGQGKPGIEHVIGPKRVFVGEEFMLRGAVTGGGAAGYVWRFKADGGDAFERRTAEPQVAVTLDKAGEYDVAFEMLGEGGVLASQLVRVQVQAGRQAAVSAGGPYSAALNRPVRLLGNARSRGSAITQYEWYISSPSKPDAVTPENAIIQHTFTAPGRHNAVFVVRLADGTVFSDTAVVNVAGGRPPVAKAGAAIVSAPGRKVKLAGTGSSPDSRIVKYEWDLNGNGVFDWSSDSPGAVEHVYNNFSYPVFRVTDAEGRTATDTMRVVICPRDMVTVEGAGACVDKYEWPNRRGAVPATNVSWHEAAEACGSVGKRLCAANEWRRACANDNDAPAGKRLYPYGVGFDARKCNALGNPRGKNRLAAAGAMGDCAGTLAVFDMSGNAAEWTASPDAAKAQALGGFYQSGEDESDCGSSLTLDKERKYPYVGFRCCK